MTRFDGGEADRRTLRAAAEQIAILARCLDLEEDLAKWQDAGDEISGGNAADGLDQALGLLQHLRDEHSAELVEVIQRIADELPPLIE